MKFSGWRGLAGLLIIGPSSWGVRCRRPRRSRP